MSIIQSLTQNQPSQVKQLSLSSTLPSKINTIEGLQRFRHLRKLNLSNNCIKRMENLSHLTELKVLNLEFNQIMVLQNTQNLVNLEELLLSYNSIEHISQKIQNNRKMKVLKLGYNQIKSLDVLMPIFGMDKIVVLGLHGNPFLNTLNYMVFIKLLMPQLVYLDEKDLNNTNLQAELYPQEQVAILRDTLNKLLQQRNYLAQQLQNLTSISSPTKINLRQYIKQHQRQNNSQQNSIANSNIKIATFSPQKGDNLFLGKNKMNQRKNKSVLKNNAYQDQSTFTIQNFENKNVSNSQREKMLEILEYWTKKIEDKMILKKKQVKQLHQYYTNKLKQKQYKNSIQQQKSGSSQSQQKQAKRLSLMGQNNIFQSFNAQTQSKLREQRNSSKKILQQIKQKQSQLNCYKQQTKSIKQLIYSIKSLQPNEEMYKLIMMKILFGQEKQEKQYTKRQLNFKELKHFLLSEYGLLNALNDLNRLIFGANEFDYEQVRQISRWSKGKTLLEIVNEAKSQLKSLKKEQKMFDKQKHEYLKKLQIQTQQLFKQWSQFNEDKKQFEFEKGKHLRYEHKLLDQRQKQIESKLQEMQQLEKNNVEKLKQERINVQNEIQELQERLSELQEKYERKYIELQQFQKQFDSFKQEKQSMIRMQDQLNLIKKQLFQKQNLIAQTQEKLKQLSLSQQINSQRLKFLQRKCYQKSQEIKLLDEQEKKAKQKLRKLLDEQKLKNMQLQSIKTKIHQFDQQQTTIIRSIQRHKTNLALYEQKLKNLSQLESHKKKSIQDLELASQQKKADFMQLSQKALQLQEILAQKQEHIHSYQLKISEHKKSLESYADMTKNIHDLMERQSQLKKSILQLEIQNGNLMDMKNQLIRQLRQNQSSSAFKGKNDWIL